MARREPAMTDVARVAGVSHQTVSRVLNAHPNVSESTRLRVRAAIAELGYRPNRAARALATGRSQLVGVIAQSSLLFGPASMLAALERAAAEAGFATNLVSVPALDRESIAWAVDRQLQQRVAGIVVIAPVDSAQDALAEIPSDVPVVAIDGDPAGPTPLVTVDQAAGAALATQRLLDAGHETVWHISGPDGWFDSAGRIAGWQATLRRAGRPVPDLVRGDWSAAAGYEAGRALSHMDGVTAVFTANDHLALGLLRALAEEGRRVPRDVSIVGFDDVPEAAYYYPPLTTIRPDFPAVAIASLTMLLSRLDLPDEQPTSVTIRPTLIDRASVGPPTA